MKRHSRKRARLNAVGGAWFGATRIKNTKTRLEEVPMQANSRQNTHPNSAADVGFLLGIGIVGVAIILALLYAFW